MIVLVTVGIWVKTYHWNMYQKVESRNGLYYYRVGHENNIIGGLVVIGDKHKIGGGTKTLTSHRVIYDSHDILYKNNFINVGNSLIGRNCF